MRRAQAWVGWAVLLGLSWAAGELCAGSARAEDRKDPAAEAMMVAAHRARASWGEDFPGFSATATAVLDGKVATGTVSVSASGTATVTMADPAAKAWVERTVGSIAMHRLASARDDYDVSFADDQTAHPLGRLIKFHGGATHSLYRVRDDVITEVHRTLDEVRFTITVSDVDRTPRGVLPRHYNVSYWSQDGSQLVSNEDFQDEWVLVGKFDLPARRLQVTAKASARQVLELRLGEHRLLPPTK